MVYYELKKILCRTGSKIALVFLGIVLIANCYSTVHSISYIDENGNIETGITAIQKLKAEKKKWAGELTEENIARVIAENNQINWIGEAQSEDIQQQNQAYTQKNGMRDIQNMIIQSFCEFDEYDYNRISSLVPEDAEEFYKNRILHLETYLNGEKRDWYTEEKKEFLLKKYEELETPFFYDFADGWDSALRSLSTVTMVIALVIGFLVSGIFSREAQLKADAIFYSSFFGRDRAVWAKVKAGFLLSTGIYWGSVFLFSAIVFCITGIDGMNCPIQIKMSGWNSFYSITFGEEYFWLMIGGYIGSLFAGFLTMLISAKTKSSVFAVTVPFILIFIPPMILSITGASGPLFYKMLGAMPQQLFQLNQVFSSFNLYKIGGKLITSATLLIVLYFLLSVIQIPFIYFIYRKKHVS